MYFPTRKFNFEGNSSILKQGGLVNYSNFITGGDVLGSLGSTFPQKLQIGYPL